MDLLVVGAGTMGRWFAEAVEGTVDGVTFVDREPAAAAEAAAEAGERADAEAGEHADAVGADAIHARGPFDAVCVAVPLPAVAEAIADYANLAERAVLDVTGVMEPAVATMDAHAPDRERASLHPLFAPENEPGTVAVVVDEPGPTVDRLLGAVESRGNDLYETTPAEHDEAMKTVQTRAHAAVLSYALTAEDVPDAFHTPVSQRLAEAVSDVTGGNPRVYADVQDAFDGAEDVAAAAQWIAEADRETFEQLYAEADSGAIEDR